MTEATTAQTATQEPIGYFPESIVHEVPAPDEYEPEVPAEAPVAAAPSSVFSGPLASAIVLARPATVFRAATSTTWRAAMVVVGVVALLRSVAFVAFDASAGSGVVDIAWGAFASLAGPALFALAVAAVLFAAGRSRGVTFARALSIGALSTSPIVLRAIVQATGMTLSSHAIHPTGLAGLILPAGVPAVVLYVLAPIDVFGIWSFALAIVALVVTLGGSSTPAPVAELVDGSAASLPEAPQPPHMSSVHMTVAEPLAE